MLLLVEKLLSSESLTDAVAMTTMLQMLTVMVSTLGSVSVRLFCQLCFCDIVTTAAVRLKFLIAINRAINKINRD